MIVDSQKLVLDIARDILASLCGFHFEMTVFLHVLKKEEADSKISTFHPHETITENNNCNEKTSNISIS